MVKKVVAVGVAVAAVVVAPDRTHSEQTESRA